MSHVFNLLVVVAHGLQVVGLCVVGLCVVGHGFGVGQYGAIRNCFPHPEQIYLTQRWRLAKSVAEHQVLAFDVIPLAFVTLTGQHPHAVLSLVDVVRLSSCPMCVRLCCVVSPFPVSIHIGM